MKWEILVLAKLRLKNMEHFFLFTFLLGFEILFETLPNNHILLRYVIQAGVSEKMLSIYYLKKIDKWKIVKFV